MPSSGAVEDQRQGQQAEGLAELDGVCPHHQGQGPSRSQPTGGNPEQVYSPASRAGLFRQK